MTLKTVLRNFLNHVESVEAKRLLGEDQFESEFQKLKELTEQLKQDADYRCHQGELDVNRRKNRYKDILPYDYTRVVISEYPGVPGSDFINANYIKGASGSRAYIASQGPLPNTVADFWRMIWECEVRVIVMACNERESGKYKCECYWPEDGEQRQYGNITIEQVQWRKVCPDFLLRTLRVRSGEEERSLCQFHYTTWPDHGVPTSVQPILDLVRLIRDCQAYEAAPILVHCSAGCGRTGTICAIDYVWGLMRLGRLPENFNLLQIISDMRRQRIAMVQTKEQYVLVHRAVLSLFEQQLRVIDSHTYENLDEDGQPLVLKESQQKSPEVEHIYEDVRVLTASELAQKDSRESIEKKVASCSSVLEPPQDSTQGEKMAVQEENAEGAGVVIPPARRNSQVLQKLRREESVKRLITGWSRVGGEVSVDSVEPIDSAIPSSVVKEQNPAPTLSSDKQTLEVNHTPPKSEKLIGKATVIRRPSIARLKALFEKSHNSSEIDDYGRKRRPLGRSHSHHVPRGSTNEEISVICSERNPTRRIPSPESNDVMLRVKGQPRDDESTRAETSDVRAERALSWNGGDDCKVEEGSNKIEDGDINAETSHEVVDESKPPELPLKKKFINRQSSVKNVPESQCRQAVNQQRCSALLVQNPECNFHAYQEPSETKHIHLNEIPPRLPEKKVLGRLSRLSAHMVHAETRFNPEESKFSVNVPSDTGPPVKNIQDIQKTSPLDQQAILHHEKLRRGAQNVAFCYTNINLTSKKNIAQIENTLKHHPRGAIIDLTSRTSFVEQPNVSRVSVSDHRFMNNVGNHQDKGKNVEYETVWVKRNSSREPAESTVESQAHRSEQLLSVNACKNQTMENDSKAAKDETNKNLLLHSPPLRTRRSHLTRTISKPKVEINQEEASQGSSNISADQEINKAVKELNSLGILLDALASDTLENLKLNEKPPAQGSGVSSKEQTPEPDQASSRPVLPQKQKSVRLKPPDSVPSRSNLSKQHPEVTQKHFTPIYANEFPRTESNHIYGQINRASNIPNLKDSYPNSNRTADGYEYIYPLQKSASAPHAGKPFTEHIRNPVNDRQNVTYSNWESPLGIAPPKPPRTFAHVPQQTTVRLDANNSGRLIVSVASPKSVKMEDVKNAPQYLESSESSKPQTAKFLVQRSPVYPEKQIQTSAQRVTDLYSSTPNSPSSRGPPHPSYYQTYPIYPEIHTIRTAPIPRPADPSHAGLHPNPPPYNHRHSRTVSQGTSNIPKGSYFFDPSTVQPPGVQGLSSCTPDYGEVPVVPVYTTVRPEQDRHRVVQWDTSVDFQQQGKSVKHYESIYDVPKDCRNAAVTTERHDLPPFAGTGQGQDLRHSQSDASVYTVLRSTGGMGSGKHSASADEGDQSAASSIPLYSQVMKPRRPPHQSSSQPASGNSNHPPPPLPHHHQRRSRDDMDLQPVAPPRNKRHLHLRRSMADGGLASRSQGQDFQSMWHSDSEEEIPPAVPAKTKGAYITVEGSSDAKGWHGGSGGSAGSGRVTSSGGLGGTLSRALGKLNLLSKLASRDASHPPHPPHPPPHHNRHINGTNGGIAKEDSPSRKVGSTPGPRSPIFGFPTRLHRKPKGAREPPEQWTQV